MARVFISHASADLALAGELHRWLIGEGHDVFLDLHPRDGIAVGEQWKRQLRDRMRWANAVVCVVTSAYLVSEWCTAEVNSAKAWGNRLLPVRAEPGVRHPLLTSFQYAEMAADDAVARLALTEALRRVDTAGDADWPDAVSPFPGLRPFGADRHRMFFGRDRDIEQLVDMLHTTAEYGGGGMLMVVGPSGCGKSSLVRAGLLPTMAGEPGWWTLPQIVPGSDPVGALAGALAGAARKLDLSWTAAQVRRRLDAGDLIGLVGDLLRAAPGAPQHLLMVVDQFEELLTRSPPGERTRFVAMMRQVLSGPVELVGTLRPEFVDQLGESELAALRPHTYPLRPLRREALRTVIEGPARRAGIEVDEQLVARLVEDTDSGEALPLLAFTLAQLAEGVSRGGRLPVTRYEQLGGVQGALSGAADAALTAAAAASSRTREDVIAGLLRLVTVDDQGSPTRWRVRREELPDPVVAELDAFVARRLLTTDRADGSVLLGAAHEAFLSTWPPLAEAISANVSPLRSRRMVEHAATEWDNNGRLFGRLWSGGQLAAVVADTGVVSPPAFRLPDWLTRRHYELVTDRVDLSPLALDFLRASINRERFRRRRAITILSILLVLAIAGAGFAITQQRAAAKLQQVTAAHELVSQAELVKGTDPQTALQLGIAAQRIHPDGQALSSLVNTLVSTRYAGALTGHRKPVSAVAFSRDRHKLATGSADNTVILWDMTDPARPQRIGQPLVGHTDSVTSLAFTPDGHTVAAGGNDGTVIVWDLIDPAGPRLGQPFTGFSGAVNSVAFSPDGRMLAAGSEDGTALLWDMTDPIRTEPHQLLPLNPLSSPVFSVAFAPYGGLMAVGLHNGRVILLDVTDPALPRHVGAPLAGHTASVTSVAFASDGRMLATGSTDRTAIVWDLTDPASPRRIGEPLVGHSDSVTSVAFAPDGRMLATGSADNTAILWDLNDPAKPRRFGELPTGHSGLLSYVAFSPDGHMLAIGVVDTTVVLWDLTDPARPGRVGPSLDDMVRAVAFAPGGRLLATGNSDSTVVLRDITAPGAPRRVSDRLIPDTDSVNSVAFAPHGHLMAVGGGDLVVLWDLADPSRPQRIGQPLAGHAGSVTSVAFADQGGVLAAGSGDGTVVLWDLADPSRPQRIGQPLAGHAGSVTSVAFADRGSVLAAGSGDGAVVLWDLADPSRPQRIGQPLAGHADSVRSVAFDAQGGTLASSSADGNVILWDLADPAHIRRLGQPLAGHEGWANSVAFAPDGRTLAMGSNNGTALLWDLGGLTDLRAHAVERACAITRHGLNRTEWARYVPALPYQETCSG